MKTINLKWITIAFSALMLLQGCRVYHKTNVTVDEAITSSNRIKAKTFVEVTYVFNDLLRDDGQLYGLAKRNSSTAKKLSTQIVDKNRGDKYVKIAVLENTIKEYHLQNKTLSTILTVAIPVVVIIVIGALAFGDVWNYYYGN
ncbi:MAG: hypothetical protein O6940_06280 [Ignavibacteria bacterium]|nr:hypothetical protein [Ignavibacteria bacterium]